MNSDGIPYKDFGDGFHFDKYVRVHLYTDGQGEVYARNRAFQEARFGTVALPFYALMSPDDREISRFPGLTRDRDLFVQFLEKGLSPDLGSTPPSRHGEGF